jgi:TonB family protein
LVIFPESSTTIGFKNVDGIGTTLGDQISFVSIERSLVAFENTKKQERHQKRTDSRMGKATPTPSSTPSEIAPTSKASFSMPPPKAGSVDSLTVALRSQMEEGTATVGPTSTIESPSSGSYMAALYSRIKRGWLPPNKEFGRVIVHFKIKKDGNLSMSDLRLEKSSGNIAADKTALGAVVNAFPFDPLPDEFPNPYETSVAFDYNHFR